MADGLRLTLGSLERTAQVGRALGEVLQPGAIGLFFGDMAAGKTTFIKSVCAGCGIAPEMVISPTYTLANLYPGDPLVCHVDLFRLESPEALLDMDQNDWLRTEGITLIEWPIHALPMLEGEAWLELFFTVPSGAMAQESRVLEIVDPQGRYRHVLDAIDRFKTS